MEAESYFIAVPLLSSYAYRECLATNSTGMSFPGGEATVYMDDRLIGNMDLRPIAAGQKSWSDWEWNRRFEFDVSCFPNLKS